MATQLVNFDAETGTLANYFNSNVQTCASITTAKAHNGTKSILYAPRDFTSMNGDLVMEVSNVFSGTSGNFANWTAAKTELYVKFWWWMPSGITAGGGGAHAFRIKSNASGSQLDCQQPSGGQPSGGHYKWDLAVLGPGLPGGGYSIFNNYGIYILDLIQDQWNECELRMILNSPAGTGNGTLTTWVGGVQQFHRTDLQLRGDASHVGWDIFAMSTNYDPGEPHAGGDADQYFDELEIWDGIPSGDTTDPVCTITGPTSSATYTTGTSPLTISGTASDDVALSSVTWSNDRGGSGTAAGTTSWSFSATLSTGANVITVTATDTSANTATDTITVTYSPDSRILSLRPTTMM